MTQPPLSTAPADHNVFAGNPLDRAANERKDPAWLQGQHDDPARRILPVWRLRFPVDEGAAGGAGADLIWLPPAATAALPAGATPAPVLLGLRDGVPHFALDVSALDDPAALDLAPGAAYRDLRGIASSLPPADSGLAAQARSLVDWHSRHGFCPACGAATAPEQGGAFRVCAECDAQHFPRTDPVVITLIHDGGDRCLLAARAAAASPDQPPPMFTCIAGFVDQGETVEAAVRREAWEEVGVRVTDVRYDHSQPWPFPSSLMLGCRARAETTEITVDGDEIGQAHWFTREQARRACSPGYDPATDGGSAALLVPPPLAIAHHLIRRWAEE
ncbi:MAG: NAD(+) diphosphatase [Chloroflexi bacterium]|nr:NAD(+) diphosphatase [Chloroflexota bacterium]